MMDELKEVSAPQEIEIQLLTHHRNNIAVASATASAAATATLLLLLLLLLLLPPRGRRRPLLQLLVLLAVPRTPVIMMVLRTSILAILGGILSLGGMITVFVSLTPNVACCMSSILTNIRMFLRISHSYHRVLSVALAIVTFCLWPLNAKGQDLAEYPVGARCNARSTR